MTGVFDDQTVRAVTAFQTTFGLNPDGIIGRQTWNDIYRAYRGIVTDQNLLTDGAVIYPGTTLRVGSTGEYVRLLQEYLNVLADTYPSVPKVNVDGVFGDSTDAAVRAAQTQLGLTSNGVVGPVTWAAIADRYDSLFFGNERAAGQFGGTVLEEGV